MRRSVLAFGLAFGLGWAGSCANPVPPEAVLPICDPARGPSVSWFGDVTPESGVAFEYATESYKGGALVVTDLDGDGRPDIVAGSRRGGLAVFRNQSAMRFEAVTDSGLDPNMRATASAAADLDNDGDRDLVVATTGAIHVMENLGQGRFLAASQLAETGTTEHVLPVDIDGDGLLDLYLSNYDVSDGARSTNRLLLNRGGLQFVAVGDMGAGLSWTASALDIDDDGDQDLYVANDTFLFDAGKQGSQPAMPPPWPVDLLLRNDGVAEDGTPRFTDIAAELGLATPRSSMGGLVHDFDEDGAFDLYIPDFGANKLFVRDTTGIFVDRAPMFGVDAAVRRNEQCVEGTTARSCLVLSWSAAVSDFDHDGYDELLVVNGEAFPTDLPPALLFTRGAETVYRELAPAISCMNARSLIATDLDGDGDQDLVVAQHDGPLSIFANNATPPPRSWLRLTLRGRAGNREGIGAVLTVRLASGRQLMRVVGAGGIVHASAPAEAFFGLGDETVESVHARWPSGRISSDVLHGAHGEHVIDEPE